MATVTASASIGLSLSVYPAATAKANIGLKACIHDDIDVVDNLEAITLVKLGAPSTNAAGIESYPNTVSVPVPRAWRSLVTLREVDAGGGKLRVGDIRFRLRQDDLPETPNEQWHVVADDGTHRILMVDTVGLATQYRLYCRR